MPTRSQTAIRCIILVALAGGLPTGCTQSKRDPALLSTQSNPTPHIIALINGVPISRDQIDEDLSERAGKQALIDLILDRQLEAEMNRQQLKITQADLAYEETLFVRTLSTIDPNAPAPELLDALRSSKGLGLNRYPRLLRRNAMLRKLVGDIGSPSETEYELSERIAFGSTYRVRIFVSSDRRAASELRQRILAESSDAQRWVFADACSTNSIHPSAPRGGLIPKLSTDDPVYPSTLTQAIAKTDPGELSVVLSTDAGYALVLIESKTPAITPTPDQIQSLRSQLALRKQRIEMERLADELLDDAQVIVTDRALNWTWTNAR